MARRSKPVAEIIENAQTQTETAPEAQPYTPGDAAEPAQVSVEAATFTIPDVPKPRTAGLSRDDRNGISVEIERERKPGTVAPRVLIRFHEGHLPNQDEKAKLKDEGFSYDSSEKAWTAPKSAANMVVAKRAVNDITAVRDPEGSRLYV